MSNRSSFSKKYGRKHVGDPNFNSISKKWCKCAPISGSNFNHLTQFSQIRMMCPKLYRKGEKAALKGLSVVIYVAK